MKRYLPLLGFLLAVGCSSDDKSSGQDQDEDEPTTIPYTASLDDFPNPERGFYHYSDTRASNYTPLDADELATYRSPQTADGASYSVVSTLVFRYFILDTYTATPLEESFLTQVQADFAAARDAGIKLIPRFTYTVTATAGECPESFICPPYGDAAKATVLGHIGQLKPLLQDNADVIACVQLGFFGTWGENYYSDHSAMPPATTRASCSTRTGPTASKCCRPCSTPRPGISWSRCATRNSNNATPMASTP